MKTMDANVEAPTSPELLAADNDAVSQGKASDLNVSRRKWMRGAAAVTPVVLTLRSGALAAASFTGVKAIGRLDKVTEAGTEVWRVTPETHGPATLMNGDICADDAGGGVLRILEETGNLRVDTHTTHRNGVVEVVTTSGGTAAESTKVYCTGGVNYRNGQLVAIMSTSAASSLRG